MGFLSHGDMSETQNAGGGTPSRPTMAAWYTTPASDSGPWTRLDVAQGLWQRFCSKVFGMERNWERGAMYLGKL